MVRLPSDTVQLKTQTSILVLVASWQKNTPSEINERNLRYVISTNLHDFVEQVLGLAFYPKLQHNSTLTHGADGRTWVMGSRDFDSHTLPKKHYSKEIELPPCRT